MLPLIGRWQAAAETQYMTYVSAHMQSGHSKVTYPTMWKSSSIFTVAAIFTLQLGNIQHFKTVFKKLAAPFVWTLLPRCVFTVSCACLCDAVIISLGFVPMSQHVARWAHYVPRVSPCIRLCIYVRQSYIWLWSGIMSTAVKYVAWGPNTHCSVLTDWSEWAVPCAFLRHSHVGPVCMA